MENKYYQPDITEFRVEFEFEIWKNPAFEKEHWEKKIIDYNSKLEYVDIPEIDEYLEEYILGTSNFRVKLLDSEDIESLGFIKTLQWLNNSNIYKKHPFFISLNDNKLTVFMQEKFDAVNGEILFHGNIKNRSELKVLLNQLGIK